MQGLAWLNEQWELIFRVRNEVLSDVEHNWANTNLDELEAQVASTTDNARATVWIGKVLKWGVGSCRQKGPWHECETTYSCH